MAAETNEKTTTKRDDDTDAPAAARSAVAAPAKPRRKPAPKRPPHRPLPVWRVLLHNDDTNDIVYVVETILDLTPLGARDAVLRTTEAHDTGVALLLVTHRERAELYQEQFVSKGLTVTIEPAG